MDTFDSTPNSSNLSPVSSPTAAPNISLHRLRREDLDDFQAYRTNPELARYQGWEVQSDTQALTFIEQLAICTGDTRLPEQ